MHSNSASRIKTRSAENLWFSVISFLISLVGILLIMKSNGFYPFKETTLFTFDMRDQYLPFFSSLRHLFDGDDSIFYNWSKSLGGNYFSLYAYYLSSPFSWLAALFPVELLPLAVFLMTVCKISLSGLTFSIYLNYLWSKHNTLPEDSSYRRLLAHFSLLPLAVSYALMSYNLQFSVCVMWLDGVLMLPLILLGIEKLLDGKRNLWFILPLTALFYFNYYTAYMCGIFCALFLCYRLLTSHPVQSIRKVLWNFVLSTLISLGLAAPLLIPAFTGVISGKLSDTLSDVVADPRLINYPVTDILGQLRNGAVNYLGVTSLPNIYCGYLAMICALLFLFCRRIPLRERIGAGCLTAFLLLSFYIKPLDTAWHCFMAPYSFNSRYSFLFSFCLLYMSCRLFCALPWNRLPSFSGQALRFSALELLIGILLLFTSADLGINGRAIFHNLDYSTPYMRMDEYTAYLEENKPFIDSIQASDSGMYRICQNYQLTSNDPMLLGFKGMYHYSSTYTPSVNTLTLALGMGQDWLWNTGYGTTPLTNSLLGIKYLLYDTPDLSAYNTLLTTDDTISVYENPTALEFIYSAPVATAAPALDSDPFTNQNRYLNALCGSQDLYFRDYEITTLSPAAELPADLEEAPVSSWSYDFTALSSDPVYLYMPLTPYASVDIYADGSFTGSYEYGKSIYCLCLGKFTPGEKVTITVVSGSETAPQNTHIAALDTTALQNALTSLHSGEISLTSHGLGQLEGSIHVGDGETIVTSIPYDIGWHIRIDGEKVTSSSIGSFADTFLTISSAPGEHTLEMYYISPGFLPGIAVFGITLLLLIVFQIFRNQKEKTK